MSKVQTLKANKTMLLVFSGIIFLFIQNLYASCYPGRDGHDCTKSRCSVTKPSGYDRTG